MISLSEWPTPSHTVAKLMAHVSASQHVFSREMHLHIFVALLEAVSRPGENACMDETSTGRWT